MKGQYFVLTGKDTLQMNLPFLPTMLMPQTIFMTHRMPPEILQYSAKPCFQLGKPYDTQKSMTKSSCRWKSLVLSHSRSATGLMEQLSGFLIT